MLERSEFRNLLISMLSAAIAGAHLVDTSDAAAADDGIGPFADGLNCPGFQQVRPFNEGEGDGRRFQEFESCTFERAEPVPVAIPIPDLPIPDILPPGPLPGLPGFPGAPIDPAPF